MARSEALSRPIGMLKRAAERTASAATHHVRLTIIVAIFLVAISFGAASALQMQRDRAHALQMAESFVGAQARTFAEQTAITLDRLGAIGRAYVEAVDARTAGALIATSESDRILNIALADADGRFVAAMRGDVLSAAPLPEILLERAQIGRTVIGFSDPALGRTPLALLFRPDRELPARFVIVLVEPLALLVHGATDSALAQPNGTALALSARWEAAPSPVALAVHGREAAFRRAEVAGSERLIALEPVPDWPVTAAISLRAADALEAWNGMVLLYLILIFGPALAGAAVALVLVRQSQAWAGDARSEIVPDPALLARLAAADARADQAERSKAEFLAHMSHELRTPLNAVIGFAEVIAGGLYGPTGHAKYGEYARDIADAGRGLHARIGDILEFANIEAGRMPLATRPVDVAASAATCAGEYRALARSRGISLETAVPGLPPASGDAEAVKRILTILLSNALRYTPEGGAIRVEGHADDGMVMIGVRDDGFGFSPDEAARAGKPFARFDRPGAAGGNGLGLAMAMALARRMGGALILDGKAGEGTWAELKLPRA